MSSSQGLDFVGTVMGGNLLSYRNYQKCRFQLNAESKRNGTLSMTWSKPILRWAGSKTKLLPALVDRMPNEFDRYVEPFAGSACLFFATRPRNSLLNDINQNLIATYEQLKKHPRKLAREVRSIRVDEKTYYRIRDVDPDTQSSFQQAVSFVYLNRHCFNGVYRTNRKGRFNVPMGKKTGKVPSEQVFFRCYLALKSASLMAEDFEVCLDQVEHTDFVYLDPPYSTSSRPRCGEYGYDSFQPPEISRLFERLKTIDEIGAKFLLSYAFSSENFKRFKRWNCEVVEVRRHVSGFVGKRGNVKEVLVSNY